MTMLPKISKKKEKKKKKTLIYLINPKLINRPVVQVIHINIKIKKMKKIKRGKVIPP